MVVPLQKRLNTLGFDCGSVDGIAGAKFTSAVNAYQKIVLGYGWGGDCQEEDVEVPSWDAIGKN